MIRAPYLAAALLMSLLQPLAGHAGICTSITSGNWNLPSTWSCGHVPQGGDSVIVQTGHTVSVTQNHVYSGQPLHIWIYGTWYFSGGGSKVTLPCGSYVEIMPPLGQLLPNSNSGGHSETVRICNATYWYFDQGTQLGYQIWPYPTLPAELISFRGRAVDDRVFLTWATATEHNSERFELFRSKDGLDRYLVAVVAAQGYSSMFTQYNAIDEPGASGLWYYSLEEVDLDGQRFDEGTLALMVGEGAEKLLCAPNPVNGDHLMVTSRDVLTDATVHVSSTDQRTIHTPHVSWSEDHLLMLDVSSLAPGLYIANVDLSATVRHHCTFVVR